jgi:curli production assembly/transport component CsgF
MKYNLSAIIMTIGIVITAHADELVYEPINPSFGGSSLNGNWLLSQAKAQDTHEDPDTENDLNELSDLDKFNNLLQRVILSRLASAITSSIIGEGGELIPGTIETSDFIIEIVDAGGGILNITTTDILTGDTTSFEINNSF